MPRTNNSYRMSTGSASSKGKGKGKAKRTSSEALPEPAEPRATKQQKLAVETVTNIADLLQCYICRNTVVFPMSHMGCTRVFCAGCVAGYFMSRCVGSKQYRNSSAVTLTIKSVRCPISDHMLEPRLVEPSDPVVHELLKKLPADFKDDCTEVGETEEFKSWKEAARQYDKFQCPRCNVFLSAREGRDKKRTLLVDGLYFLQDALDTHLRVECDQVMCPYPLCFNTGKADVVARCMELHEKAEQLSDSIAAYRDEVKAVSRAHPELSFAGHHPQRGPYEEADFMPSPQSLGASLTAAHRALGIYTLGRATRSEDVDLVLYTAAEDSDAFWVPEPRGPRVLSFDDDEEESRSVEFVDNHRSRFVDELDE